LKTPLSTSSDDPSALRKFFDEARNADRITHPNICRIHALQEHRDAAGDHPSVLFFTMEFIDGETLAARLRRSPLPLAVTRVIARQLLEGLRAAHEKRVLHLDFKSDNVMLRRSGSPLEAVIMDFGLSRQRDAVLRASQYLRGIGTVRYMALEQLEGQRNLGPAVDVYAFGVVLFEMLTGRLPFMESSLGAMLLKQQRERPPLPSTLRSGLSSTLDGFVMKCLNRAASRRFEDAGAALAAFDRLGDWAVPAAPRWWSRWRPWSAVALGAPFLMIPSSDILPVTPEPPLATEPVMVGALSGPPDRHSREQQRVEERQLSLRPAASDAVDGAPSKSQPATSAPAKRAVEAPEPPRTLRALPPATPVKAI
jgi:serine/threonine protein kinase